MNKTKLEQAKEIILQEAEREERITPYIYFRYGKKEWLGLSRSMVMRAVHALVDERLLEPSGFGERKLSYFFVTQEQRDKWAAAGEARTRRVAAATRIHEKYKALFDDESNECFEESGYIGSGDLRLDAERLEALLDKLVKERS